MYAFSASTPLAAAKPAYTSTFTHAPLCPRRSAPTPVGPTMALRSTRLRTAAQPKSIGISSTFGGVGRILAKADKYMASSVNRQYTRIAVPSGVYAAQCTEGSFKSAAEQARVRALNARYRQLQRSPSKMYFDLYENRKNAIGTSHQCHHEETQFCNYSQVAAAYNGGKSEAMGQCGRYATPETVEEAAIVRYMGIQQNIAANPSGVYNIYCNEGAAKGQAEFVRVAQYNVAFRNGQKPTGQLLQEKYNQRQQGYAACHGCSYEEGLVSRYPAIGATFRPKTYGY